MLLSPPTLQAPAPQAPGPQASKVTAPTPTKPMTQAEAEDAILLAFDEGRVLPHPTVATVGRAPLAWLRSNALPSAKKNSRHGPSPANPFRPGTQDHREAQAWQAFLKAPAPDWDVRLKKLSLGLTGTQLGLWRWGQAMTLSGKLGPEARRSFEDRLAASPVAGLRGYALRHALCFAVAEKDEFRFSALRQKFEFVEGDLFRQFQRLFSLLGGPAPVVRLYNLPGLEYADVSLGDLGCRRIWMMPAGSLLEPLPPDVAWIVPSSGGEQAAREANLDPAVRKEAEALAMRFQAAGRTARFAASRGPFEIYGLMYFPILIEVDSDKLIQSIRIGDAAPLKP